MEDEKVMSFEAIELRYQTKDEECVSPVRPIVEKADCIICWTSLEVKRYAVVEDWGMDGYSRRKRKGIHCYYILFLYTFY